MCINKDELIKWFWEKFNSCYLVKHDDYPESVFMYYDPQYIRKLKLANISGNKTNKTDKTDITGICLFELDWKNEIFCYNYYEIWHYLYLNYSIKYDEIQQFISDRLKEHPKMSVLTPSQFSILAQHALKEHPKMSVLTPLGRKYRLCRLFSLKEHPKMSVLTPKLKLKIKGEMLKEHPKMSVLISNIIKN